MSTASHAPAGTPTDVVDKLNAAAKSATQQEDFKKKVEQEGLVISAGSPAELDAYVKGEEARWRKVVKENNIKNDFNRDTTQNTSWCPTGHSQVESGIADTLRSTGQTSAMR